MSENRKRKAAEDLNGHSKKKKEKKKKVSAPPNTRLEVSHRENLDAAKPIIATTPGISLPKDVQFRAFAKPNENGSELLLQSSDHPTIDYTATESGDTASHLRNYIAIYDPVDNKLDITEAKQMTIRRTIRQAESIEDNKDPTEAVTNYSARNALTQSFGTKKFKKLVLSRMENIVRSQDANPNARNALSEALLSSMPEPSAPSRTPDGTDMNTAAVILAAKPLPKPDLTATDVSQAYPLSHLVFPSPYAETLKRMPISDWRDSISDGREIQVSSRFVAKRVDYIGPNNANVDKMDDDTPTNLHLLRYILLLVEIYRKVSQNTRKSLPQIEKWDPTDLSDRDKLPTPFLTTTVKKYCNPGDRPTEHSLILLKATILALTLHIPPRSGIDGDHHGVLATDPTDIRMDLNLESGEVRKLFRELGCTMERPMDAEWERWGLKRPEQTKSQSVVKFAKLKLPLVFPRAEDGKVRRTVRGKR